MITTLLLALLPLQGWTVEELPALPQRETASNWGLVAAGDQLVLIENFAEVGKEDSIGGVFVLDEVDQDWVRVGDMPHHGVLTAAGGEGRIAVVAADDALMSVLDLRTGIWRTVKEDVGPLDNWSVFAFHGSQLYSLGHRWPPAARPEVFAEVLDLGVSDLEWRSVPWPQHETGESLAPTWQSGVAIQGAGAAGESLFMMGGKTSGVPGAWRSDAWRLDLATQVWQRLPDIPEAMAYGPVAYGKTDLLLFGSTTWSWNTVTGTWVDRGKDLLPQSPASIIVSWQGRLVQLTVERDGAQPRVLALTLAKPEAALGAIDLGVLVGYLALLIGLGIWFSRREQSTEDFFLAGQRIPWWAAGISLFATQLSAITFLGTPAVSYATDWMLLPSWLGILFFAPLAVKVFLPLYRKRPMRTVYTWLEWRFGVSVRLFGSFSFLIFQLLRMGVVVYLPSLALSTATGVEVWQCVLLMGVLATIYTVLGGMEAVIWTDVLQTGVLLVAVVATLWVVYTAVGDPVAALATAADAGKLRTFGGGWSTVEAATWALLLGGFFLQFGPYTADQAMVQRYLTTKDEKAAARGIWLNGWMSVPAGALFILVGTALWLYYRARPEALDLGVETDAVFPLFLAKELPTGVSGLVIAGLFAAAMSTLDSGMHAVATTCTTDWYERLSGRVASLRQARVATFVAGAVATAIALLLAASGILSSLLFFLKALGLLTSGVAGVFLLGVMSKRAHSVGALTGAAFGTSLLAWVVFTTDTYLFVYPLIGIPTTVITGWLASRLIPAQPAAGTLSG